MQSISQRWKAWRAPQVRRARKAQRRQRWDQARADAESYTRRHGPPATEVYVRSFKNAKR